MPLQKRSDDLRVVWAALLAAFAIWYLIFGLKVFNFWWMMAAAATTLAGVAFFQQGLPVRLNQVNGKAVLTGLAAAVALYALFWLGNIVSRWLFSFAGEQISAIYGHKAQASPYIIAFLLVFVIGPAEEIFWRGFIQDRFAARWGERPGLFAGAAAYTLVHVWSGNLVLMLAALVGGLFWGLLYKQMGSLVPGIISHAAWDVVVFVLFPLAPP